MPHKRGSTLDADSSDEQLMLAFREGDAAAFEALVQRHRGPVCNFILRSTGNPARAEDLLQESWLKVIRGSRQYEPKARFTTWLYTIARNLCVDSARRETFREVVPLEASRRDGAPPMSDWLADARPEPDRAAHSARLRPLLEQALMSLPQEQREVFLLREYSGVPFKEIASVVGMSENTVKSRMRYALEGLRRRLLELGVDGEWVEDGRTVAR